MRRQLLLIACLLLTLAGCRRPALTPVTLDGGRTIHVYQPRRASDTLVIALHGGATSGPAMARYSGLLDAAADHRFTVIFPDGSGRIAQLRTWNAGTCCGYAVEQGVDDVAFIAAVIDHAVASYGVNPDHVLLTGISNGAMLAYRFAAERPEAVAAIAPIAGTLTVPLSAVSAPVPVIHFHGDADTHVPFAGGSGPDTVPGQAYTSVPDTLAAWVAAWGITAAPEITTRDAVANDGTSLTRAAYRDGDGRERVVLVTLHGGGHTWPGQPTVLAQLGPSSREIDANDAIWQFFEGVIGR